LVGVLSVLLLPATSLIALAIDAVRRTGRLATLRCVLGLTLYLACESVGLVASFLLWVAHHVLPGGGDERFLYWNLVLQRGWAGTLFRGAVRIFRMRIEVTGAEVLAAGPLFVLSRHASTLDTLLPAVFVSHPVKLRLRWIMKRELRWDPCLDVVGRRTRNAFIARASSDPGKEVEVIRCLAQDLKEHDGVLIFPEGTRFSASKRNRAVARLTERQPQRLAAARALRHLLPPHPGGTMALLDMRPDVDVVFLVHSGFEGTTDLIDIVRGTLVGRPIRLHFWRIPAARLPRAPADRVRWLDEQWARMDEWLEAGESRESLG
jgi:1-acyl-sn-glycerol-3-phosphate acyltransferase